MASIFHFRYRAIYPGSNRLDPADRIDPLLFYFDNGLKKTYESSCLNLVERNFTMNEKLIETIVLKNGLILEIHDQSRKIAGDRWLVKIAAKIDIPIDSLNLDATSTRQVSLNSLKASFDSFIRYEQKRERNFVGEQQKDTILHELVTSFLSSNREYLSHPDFAVRYALREHLKQQQRKTWYPVQNEA